MFQSRLRIFQKGDVEKTKHLQQEVKMSRILRPTNFSLVLVTACAVLLLTAGTALAEAQPVTWVDKTANALNFYKKQYTTVTYPGSNWKTSAWEPYEKKLAIVREAVKKGDKEKARAEMNQFLTMLLNREHGIHTTAANGLYHETLTYMYDFFKEEKKS
jgi:hypothetical protein